MLSGVFPTFLGAFFTPSKFQSMMICMAKCSSDTFRRRPELILGQNAKEDREPHSCQLGTNEIVWKCGDRKLDLKEESNCNY
jgi:hypothetical protein